MMKLRTLHTFTLRMLLGFLLALTTAGLVQAQAPTETKDQYQKAGEGLTVFGEVYRHIHSAYMDQVESDEILNVAIEAMTNYLDPYSVYYPEEERDDLNVIYDGSYVGLGMNAVEFQGAYTIVRVYPEFGADKAGLMIGDRITHVDSIDLADTTISLKTVLEGEVGDTLHLSIVRAQRDTLQVLALLDNVQTKAVPYFKVLEGGVGYIQLARFTRQSQREFRQALHQMYREQALNGLIIDIRGNRGGLLHAAAGIAELFLDQGSLIVSTKGRVANNNAEYRSRLAPMYPSLPLAVLIDEQSASASEILASALQDHNRATIIGKQSFGKGLVQNVLAVPYGGQLKLTTARYYTPKGRLLQKIDYSAKRKGIQTDSLSNPEGWRAGVSPDIVVATHTDSELTEHLYRLGLFEMFVSNGVEAAILDSVELFADFVVASEFALAHSSLATAYELNKSFETHMQNQLQPVIASLRSELHKSICSHAETIRANLHKAYIRYSQPFEAAMSTITQSDLAVTTANQHLLTTASAEED